ncbi:MAG TPA: maltose/maltodextrin ABC transporter substrate-binding protein MalE [Noviherbaspirillum sp.]|nr:maltose/maltodextrin ABC transporter substrate-binding protein MalE [Noviherbaspirillum sp.]
MTVTTTGGRLLLAAALLCLFAACAPAAEPGTLLIWINGDKGYKGLAKVGEAYTRKTGVPVIVETPEDAPTAFQQAASAGKGPDIWIWAHDRIGDWISSGLIQPIRPSRAFRATIAPLAWDAFMVGARTWGYPLSIEAVALVYNKDLAPIPPARIEDIPALDKKLSAQGRKAILWDYTNTYFSWPLLAAGGAYAFGPWDSGRYDKTNTGVNTAGGIAGTEAVVKLVKEGILPKGAGYAEMEAGFHQGKVAMMINGPWSWEGAKKAKINFGVAPIPSIGGKPAVPFVGVLGAMISSASPNKALATEFLETHMLSLQSLKTIDADRPLGVPANIAFYEELKSNPHIRATMESAEAGKPMPNNPEMSRFWSSMKVALENATQGRQTPREALDQASKRILGAK